MAKTMRFSEACFRLAALGGPNAAAWERLACEEAAKERQAKVPASSNPHHTRK
jgi:hypothetical protein